MYLNYSSVVYSSVLTENIVPGTHAHVIPSSFIGTDTGFVYAVEQLANQVVIPSLPHIGKTAFVLAGGNAHFAGLTKEYPKTALTYDYKIVPRTLTQVFAHRQAQNYLGVELIYVDHTACASSLFVLDYCRYLMYHRGFERVIVLAVEDAVSTMSVEFFKCAGVDSALTPSAFDQKNLGFNLGQGAATAVFEKEPTEKCLARLCDVASASEDCHNPLGMREDGQGYSRAMLQLDATLRGKVSIVKTHGTGTVTNNVAERTALEATLKKPFVATSFKPLIGHTLGASGLLESILLLNSIATDHVVPKIANRTEEDTVFLSSDTPYVDGLILALAAGMGNVYSAAIWEPWNLR